MKAQELALLVEFSEARAYASLMHCAPAATREADGLATERFGSAVAVVAQSVTRSLNMNRVIGLGVAEPASEATVDRIVQRYDDAGVSFGIEVGPHVQPAELTEWLRARRIRRGVVTALHYRPTAQVETPQTDVSVIRASRAQAALVADICCEVFSMPNAAHAIIEGTADNPSWRQWLAFCNDVPVGAALSFVGEGVAWLGWDATLPGFRGRGIQSTLISHRLADAANAGCAYATSETAVNAGAGGDPSFRNYRRAGFSVAYERATYIRLRGARRKDG